MGRPDDRTKRPAIEREQCAGAELVVTVGIAHDQNEVKANPHHDEEQAQEEPRRIWFDPAARENHHHRHEPDDVVSVRRTRIAAWSGASAAPERCTTERR